MRLRQTAMTTIFVLLIATACSNSGVAVQPTATAPVTATIGMELFDQRVIGSNPGCVTCHSLEAGVTLVGPSLAGIGGRAAEQVPGLAATEYLRQAIVEPDAYVVQGFESGLMLGNWDDLLTREQIQSLVEVLLEL